MWIWIYMFGVHKRDIRLNIVPMKFTFFLKSQNGILFRNILIAAEKAMAPHSSTLAWRIPWTRSLVGLQSMGLQRVGHDWVTSLSLFTFTHWRRKWQPTPVFLPGESEGWGSLVGCRLWGCTELDMTEAWLSSSSNILIADAIS